MAQSKIKTWYAISSPLDDEADVFIYDVIGAWAISADAFVKELRGVKSPTINVHINSPGGSVFDGFAIYNALKATKAKIVCIVDGIAASIASVIAMAGDEIYMAENAFLMIHNPSTFAMGDSDDLRKAADVLDALAAKVADVYAKRTGESSDTMQEKMDDETWYTAQEAIEAGLADSIVEDVKAANSPVASIDTSKMIRNSKAIREAIACHLNQQSQAEVAGGREISKTPVSEKPQTEKFTMNASQFTAFAAENPEAAEVKALIAQGHKAGKSAGRLEAITELTAIVAVCPGREKLAIDSFAKGQDVEAVKSVVASLDTEAAQHKAELNAKNAEIDRLKALGNPPKPVSRGPEPEPQNSNDKLKACEKIVDPAARAKAEWAADASLAESFTDEKTYVAYRKAELNGQIKHRGSR